MDSLNIAVKGRLAATKAISAKRTVRMFLPALSMILVLIAIAWLNPRALSYFGFNLMLNLATPIVLATLGQLCIIAVNDLDLSIGYYVSFVVCVTATWLMNRPLLGVLVLAGCVGIYGALGALIHIRRLPSIVVTLGMSFVWQGAAILILPQPGGASPAWMHAVMTYQFPFLPFPVVAGCALALIAHFALMQTSLGVIFRGAGGNPRAISHAGWSLTRIKIIAYVLAGTLGMLSGFALLGLSTAGDPNIGNGYTLLSVAGVILGGGEFQGGRVSPIGAVIGSMTLALASTSLLAFMHVPPDWQVGANGIILIVILAARAVLSRGRLIPR